MFRYSTISRARLDETHPELQLLFETVLEFFDHSIYCGHRGQEDQDAAYFARPQRSKVRWPNGKHNSLPSMAVDAGPYFRDVDRWDREQCLVFGGFVMGVARMLFERGEMTYRVRWGGDWDMDNNIKDQSFDDLVHFELVEA